MVLVSKFWPISCIFSFAGTFVNRDTPSDQTRISVFCMFMLWNFSEKASEFLV
jgi:hypothetical protein